MRKPRNITLVEWVLRNIFLPTIDGCWLWKLRLHPDGYGLTYDKRRTILVHRLLYQHFIGPIPADKELDHLCRNPRCVNPTHLEAVSHRENVLRGEGLAAINAVKTHCSRGHEYTPENTCQVNNRRHCLSCCRLYTRKK